MAAWYFEEILSDLKKMERVDECSDVLACVSVTVCGAAEVPKEQAGK